MSSQGPSGNELLDRPDKYLDAMGELAGGKVDCPRCDGTGDEPGRRTVACNDCAGAGITRSPTGIKLV